MFDYWKLPPYNFAGISEKSDFESARYVVVPVPYDDTASYKTGAREGPAAIINASRNMELFDTELGDICEQGICTLDEVEPARGNAEETVKRVEFVVSKILESKKVPVLLGGDHSVTIGALMALPKDTVIVQFDAHADMREEFEGSRYSHACVMRRASEKFKTVQIGLRSFDKDEHAHMKKIGAEYFPPGRIDAKKIIKLVKGKNVYVTIDIDALDPSIAPGTGTPEPEGLKYGELVGLLDAITKNAKLAGFDIVEVLPLAGNWITEFTAAKLAYKLMGLAGRK